MAVNSLAGASPDTHFSIAQRQLRDLPGEVSVSRFNAGSHLLGPKHPLVFDLGGIPQHCLCCPYWGHFCHPLPPCTISKWIIVTSPSVLAFQGSKTELIRAVTLCPAQPADGAGVAPHPGKDLQVFPFAELNGRSCSPVTFVVGCLRRPLAARREGSTSLLKTHNVHEAEL